MLSHQDSHLILLKRDYPKPSSVFLDCACASLFLVFAPFILKIWSKEINP